MTIGGCPNCGQHPFHAMGCPYVAGTATSYIVRPPDDQQTQLWAQVSIDGLAREIARQKSPTSVLTDATTPHEIARALYILGWQPPARP